MIELIIIRTAGNEGKRSFFCYFAYQRQCFAARAIRDCGYSLIRNAGHLMHEEKPERVAAAMFEFIPAAVPEI